MESFELIRSDRRTIAIQIRGDGRVIIRAPLRMAEKDIMAFVRSRSAWIEKHLAEAAARQDALEKPFTAAQLRELAAAAREDIARRVARFAPVVGVAYGRITIRAQKIR